MTSTMSSSILADTSFDEIEEFSCNNCDNTFKLRRALMMHMRKNHNQQGSNGSLEGPVEDQKLDDKEKEGEGVKKIGQRHRCPTCGEAFRKLPTMLLHVREDHADEEEVQVKEEDNTEVKEEQDEAEKMLCEPEKMEKEDPAKEVGENLETTVHEDVTAEEKSETAKEVEIPKAEEVIREAESPESPMKGAESPASPMKEADQKMAEDMDDIIKMCKEIDQHAAKKEAEKELEKLGEVEIAKAEEEELGGGDLSQEEDEDDRSSQCKHCGVDMVIESELKKHILLRFSNHKSR